MINGIQTTGAFITDGSEVHDHLSIRSIRTIERRDINSPSGYRIEPLPQTIPYEQPPSASYLRQQLRRAAERYRAGTIDADRLASVVEWFMENGA